MLFVVVVMLVLMVISWCEGISWLCICVVTDWSDGGNDVVLVVFVVYHVVMDVVELRGCGVRPWCMRCLCLMDLKEPKSMHRVSPL